MTTIAYRAGIMAADSVGWLGDMPCRNDHKLRVLTRGDGARLLIGMSGAETPCLRMVEALRDGDVAFADFDPSEYDPDADGTILVAEKRGARIRLWVSGKRGMTRLDQHHAFFATGAGHEFALGAMDRGATAAEAIETAKRFNAWTAGRVKTVRFP